jgi:Domain of unknown function (DUF4174)
MKLITILMLYSQLLNAQLNEHRRILLFAKSSTDSLLTMQLRILQADAKGLADRDMEYAIVTPASDSALYKKTVSNNTGFLLALYGKDGGVKFTAIKPVSLQQLYSIVDSMPMRREEIRRKQHPG